MIGWSLIPDESTNNATLLSCIPGVTRLYVYGQWLYQTMVTVGGAECVQQGSGDAAWYRICVLPIIEPAVPDLLYDLVVRSDKGQVVVAGVIGFIDKPSISALSQCWSDGGFMGLPPGSLSRCSAGEVITVTGRLFTQTNLTLTRVTLLTTYQPIINFTCLTPHIVNDSALTCVLPYSNLTNVLGSLLSLTVEWSGGWITNSLARYVYDYADAPRVLSVSGCGNQTSGVSTGLALSHCQPGNAITLVGTQLNVTGGGIVNAWTTPRYWSAYSYCSDLQVQSSNVVVCQLPTLDEAPELLLYPDLTAVLIERRDDRLYFASNCFTISFAQPSSSSSSTGLSIPRDSDTANGDRTALIASLTTVLTVALLTGVSVALWWRLKRPKRASEDWEACRAGEDRWSRMSDPTGIGHGLGVELTDR